MQGKKWYSRDVQQITEQLKIDLSQGLSDQEAIDRQKDYGPNALKEAPPRSLVSKFVDQLKEVLVLILIGAAFISGILGEWEDTIVILIIVVLNAALGVFQEHKAEAALKALKNMTKAFVKVRRNGRVIQTEVENLVPGDVILLDAGDSVPADGRMIEAASLRINEAALTGESVPAEKELGTLAAKDIPLGDQKNMVFMGTTVTGGRGLAVVTATGMHTELGRIAQMLQETPPDPTPLQRQLTKLGKILGIAAGVIVIVVFLTGLLRGEAILEMLMTAIALAVAAIPEGLPSVVTIVLALGVTRMSHRRAIIRKLPAVETLGVATYICTDKTGTLTKNEMTVTGLYVNDSHYKITGGGYQPEGEFYDSGNKKIIPLKEKIMELMLLGGCLNSDARLETGEQSCKVIGDPTEGALIVAARKAGLIKEAVEKKYTRIEEIPFDSARKMMTTFHRMDGEILSFTKGAPDILLNSCIDVISNDKLEALGPQKHQALADVNSRLASKGQRVLALAMRKWKELPHNPSPENAETKLTFIGFFAIQDPPRDEAKEAVAVSRSAGIKTVMITGDHQDTALAIAKELDIWREGDYIFTGLELEEMSKEKLMDSVSATTVYARVSPEHKLRIVEALKEKGEVVAMTGDGVNDAPALKRADIGAAMGITGTEVAKEASDMVLMDDNFATIISAVEEGRTIYNNIRKSIQYLLSCNTGEIVAIFSSILLGLGSPLTPIQILWLNLVTDGPPALALGLEPPEKGVMKKQPRRQSEGIFAGGVGRDILILGAVIGLLSLGGYWIALKLGRSLEEAHTMAFVTMALSQLFHSFNVRSLDQSLFKIGLTSNRSLLLAFIFSVAMQLIVIFVPFLREVFETALLSSVDWLIVIGLSLIPLVVAEISKLIFRRE